MAAAEFLASLVGENMILQTTLVLLVVFFATSWFFSNPRNLPPGPRGWPVVGNFFSLANEHRHLTLTDWAKTYGQIYRVNLGGQKMVVLSGYDVIQEALARTGDDFASRPFNAIFKIINPRRLGIATAPFGTPWKEHRRFTLKSLREFGFGKRNMEGKILEESVAFQTEILKMGDRPFDISRMVQNAVTNVICSLVFGSRFEYTDEKFTRLMDAFDRGFHFNFFTQLGVFFPTLRHLPGMGKGPKLIKEVLGTFRSHIKEELDSHKETFDPNDMRDLIDSYIRENKSRENDNETSFTDEYTECVLFDMFVAGTETTSTTLYWVFLYLVLNPDIQRKVQEEIHSVLGHDQPPSTAHRAQMPYTEAFLAELGRAATIAPTSVYRAASRDTSFHGYHIPEGTTVVALLWSVHYDPEHFPNPEKFDPGRFLDAQGQYRKDDHVIPFGVGSRICLGKNLAEMELFIIVTSLLQHFTFKLPEDAAKPSTIGINGASHAARKFELVAEPLA
ncbi:cytochrome P450 2U1-like [Branchiostoma lanceolatum]|uniref:cytochrome P450 2U1-like n=1 Tax=Branchiostoma lanceolatum TaxID=7740 RepID=UPI0034564541